MFQTRRKANAERKATWAVAIVFSFFGSVLTFSWHGNDHGGCPQTRRTLLILLNSVPVFYE